MAFTTQEGTGGAPWTFLGTPEADSIAVITGDVNDTTAFDFIAEGFEGNDVVNFNGVRSVTIKGGQGADLITNNVAASAALASLISSSFINGNDGEDIIGNSQVGLLATLSTVSGGQGEDEIFIGSLQSSKVNGNLGADFLEIGDLVQDENIVATFSNFNAASIFGGQGDDLIEVVSTIRQVTDSQIAGQVGNDLIAIQVGSFDLATAIEENLAFGFDPENGILTDPSTRGTIFSGGDGEDIIDASGLILFDEIDEASGSDLTLAGDDGDDSMFGGVGEDIVDGNDGDDWIAGYGGRDEVNGGKGDDLVIGAYYDGQLSVGFVGDAAGDFLSGGTGSNRFFVPGSFSEIVQISTFIANGNPLGSTGNVFVFDNDFDLSITEGDVLAVDFGADVITDWNSGAGNNVLDTGVGNTLLSGFDGDPLMSLGFFYNEEGLQNYAVRGNYVERFNEVGEFTVSATGNDIAVWTNYTGAQFEEVIDLQTEEIFLTGFSTVDNLTILENVPTTTILTANEFVAV